jgi:hypothetical protein
LRVLRQDYPLPRMPFRDSCGLCDRLRNGSYRDRAVMKPTIYFDLDGTLYDLYNVPSWLERITTKQDPTAYAQGSCMVDPITLATLLDTLVAKGYKIGVVSWLAGDASKEYDKAVRRVKRAWVKAHMPQATEVHLVKYGTPKHNIIKDKRNAILVDDNADVRNAWTRGQIIAADNNMVYNLWSLCQTPVVS